MSVKQRIHKWYVEPLNAETNEILSKNQRFLSEEQIFDGVTCGDSKPHKLWGCDDYAFLAQLIKNRVRFGAEFQIWHQESNGSIRPWVFPPKKRKLA